MQKSMTKVQYQILCGLRPTYRYLSKKSDALLEANKLKLKVEEFEFTEVNGEADALALINESTATFDAEERQELISSLIYGTELTEYLYGELSLLMDVAVFTEGSHFIFEGKEIDAWDWLSGKKYSDWSPLDFINNVGIKIVDTLTLSNEDIQGLWI